MWYTINLFFRRRLPLTRGLLISALLIARLPLFIPRLISLSIQITPLPILKTQKPHFHKQAYLSAHRCYYHQESDRFPRPSSLHNFHLPKHQAVALNPPSVIRN
ncbi:hypothetical protein BGS_0304 [Beggiatoa sp. SS]|nr:hypothetical protein BGS_0304 [Beggiatoa sp. SS]